MFQRGGYLHRLPYLSKLYSDTKQSYEAARVTSNPANVSEEPEIEALRQDFQIQQDRLLAWGLEWTETNAAEAQYHDQYDLEIDKKLDQAGLGEIVANVMAEIQRLLNESGKLQHPERYLGNKLSRNQQTPVKKEWTLHEVATGRALLDQLTTCIDVLYSLAQSRRSQSPEFNRKEDSSPMPSSFKHDKELPSIPKIETLEAAVSDAQKGFLKDSIHIVFDRLKLSGGPTLFSSDPPPYEVATLAIQERYLGTLDDDPTPILVDFVQSADDEDFFTTINKLDTAHHFIEVLQQSSRADILSHNGHLEFVGITTDVSRRRVGCVYKLPPAALPTEDWSQSRTLGSIIAETYGRTEIPSPVLEDRFRLAYNLVLSLLGYMTQQACHRFVNSSNVMFFAPNSQFDGRNLGRIRAPYLIPSTQRFTKSTEEALASMIYRHPEDDISIYNEIVPSHDIYSIGLLLLEIGMWMPLTKLWKSKYDRVLFMQRVKSVYVRNLASKCGSRYMHIVEKCLNAPAVLLGWAESSSSKKMREAVEYLIDITAELAKCCALDEEGPPQTSDLEYMLQQLQDSEWKSQSIHGQAEQPATLSHVLEHDTASGSTSTVVADTEAVQDNLQKPRAPNTRTSHTQKQGALRKWPELNIPQPDLDQWNNYLMPRLSTLLQNALSGSVESSSVSLMMIGPTAETAKTTICIQCSDTKRVQEALVKRFRPRRGWGVVVHQGKVRRSGKSKKSKRSRRKPVTGSALKSTKSDEQLYQEQPSNGASIGAYKDCEHLPPVSYGGTILVDGEPFGMTVHHMLDSPSEDDDEEIVGAVHRSAAPNKDTSLLTKDTLGFLDTNTKDLPSLDELEISEDEYSEDEDSDTSTIRPDYAAFDAEGNEFWFLDDAPRRTPDLSADEGSEFDYISESEEFDVDDNASVGDRSGINPWDKDELYVTQPAIDDVDSDFFPSEEDRDEDHLASHSFGYVHASSGIRRVISNDVKHEVDWALIRVHEERQRLSNAIKQDIKGKKKASKPLAGNSSNDQMRTESTTSDMVLDRVASSKSLSGTEVYCCGRSSGFQKGRISQAMALVKMYGRQSFSSSWCVEGGFGVPGDSGAWVYNPSTRELCGHVLAWGNRSKTAYIAPMDVLFEDIRDKLGAETVCLPGKTDASPEEKEDGRRSTTNTQLPESKDIELALKGLRIDGPQNLGPAPQQQPVRKHADMTPAKDVSAAARPSRQKAGARPRGNVAEVAS